MSGAGWATTGAMMLSEYLRQLALRCLSHSRDCFDLKGAEHFRLLADDLLAKAGELEGSADGVSISLSRRGRHRSASVRRAGEPRERA
jgi:hypothetical protein